MKFLIYAVLVHVICVRCHTATSNDSDLMVTKSSACLLYPSLVSDEISLNLQSIYYFMLLHGSAKSGCS
jgi:hypothetical protein